MSPTIMFDIDAGTTAIPSSITNSTTAPDKPYPVSVGYICAVTAVLLYGSNFVPIKKFYTGDGMFFQFILCTGIFSVGVVIQLIRQSEFYCLVMLGGVIWTTGNLCVVPIFKTIGMGLGMSIWGVCALISGWASGRFGWFNTIPNEISNSAMNYAGVGLAFASILFYVMVRNEVSGSTEMEVIINAEENDPLIPRLSGTINDSGRSSMLGSTQDRDDVLVFNKQSRAPVTPPPPESTLADDRMFIEDLSPTMKRIIGTLLSLGSGVCYGLNFMPSIYVKNNYKNSSQNDLDYVFAQFCGIFAASSFYLFIYCIVKKNSPKVYPKVILPGIISGIMWAMATACWFIANAELSESVSFPIVATGPSAIASLFWGVCIFHEIRGMRNIIVLLLAFVVMLSGVVLAGLSR